MESTYADRLHSNRQVEENRLINLVADAVKEGKKVLIPSFALGRSQEVILLLRTGMNKGIIPEVPVYVDGMVRDICRIYRLHPTCLKNKLAKSIMKGFDPFYSKEVQAVLPSADRNELVDKTGPAVFVASSGMLSGGPSVLYAEKIISREDGLIILTGYQDEEAPGRALMQLAETAEAVHSAVLDSDPDTAAETEEPTFTLAGKSIPVRASVSKVGLSAHGDQDEILGLISRLSPRDVFLVHGDAQTMPVLARLITGEHLREIHLPRCGDIKTVSYRTPRKQAERNWQWTMSETAFPDEEGMARLRQFVRQRYPERQWTAIQLMEIWYGHPVADSSEIPSWQQLLVKTVHFTSDERFFFQFHPSTEEEQIAANKPKEVNLQVIQELAAKHFDFLGYKKAGVYPAERNVVLRFMFPDAVNQEEFAAAAQRFKGETNWSVSIHPSTNHDSVQQLLRSLFGDRIAKISYFESEKTYQIALSCGEQADSELADKFQSVTGWRLRILGEGGPNQTSFKPASAAGSSRSAAVGHFNPSPAGAAKEQNAAFSHVRSVCADEGIPLQKIGVKSDHLGKYIELSFLTPEIGQRYALQIASLSEDIGWRLVISNTVVQNIVLSIASQAAERAGLVIKKGPSYMPINREVQLKVSPCTDEAKRSVMTEITEKTGLSCRILTV